MYHRRFKNRPGRKILNLQGRFSLIYTGGGNFVYTLPGKDTPVVRRLDLSSWKYRVSLSAGAFALFLFSGFGIWTSQGTASSSGVVVEEARISPAELEKRSEALKEKIIKNNAPHVDQSFEYTVRPGDTLSEIAAVYKVLPASILSASGVKRADEVKPGQKLTIPNRPGLMYRMKPGDTLAAVAQFYTVSLEDIQNDNPELRDMDLLRPGTKVFLPNAKIPPPPPIWFRPAWGNLSSGFGWRPDPFSPGRMNMHTGFDIVMYYRPVHAARTGVVVYAGGMGSYGMAVVIQHGDGLKTLYAHLSSVRVRSGQDVQAGQEIGISGNTGLSTGPHLHFEVIQNGKPVNPARFVRF
ncbi:MAG TPA: peptidoglycan DD-metalloendopeptidase family protein [Leptospiraceae bacterium]|jgi:murein DD-endopeptidase MepM/ murein hydrolase activator NlpD|nr:peptidoglycan DD-metalloendopeptidase family protein [Leptospirales bacterium]HMU85795.1 peptidoglycan DD-metalloendopeptidase family protein [Leptospiraceae bacterium]HMX57498.1 peptidoglycan DD-metalloendopeptidase family protein [Leptospiraceae bacterium]HMY46106.1 peptidoglycan DD-metalloendopeptidase family protein [Leptospiraceae bacterium]HMZ37561.1 peptidoglycan DD-metalloendopeptidase family protein [Leptospiraceae bacterium]